MDWEGHAILGLRAAQGLPQWEIDTLKPDMSPAEIGKVFMPPITNVREKLGAYCLILDWIYQKEYASYARRSDGSWIPHHPVSAPGGSPSEQGNNAFITALLEQLIADLRKGEWEEAVRHAGAL